MRTRMALLLGGAVALGLFFSALAPAQEIRIAQAAGPASAEFVARGRELFNDHPVRTSRGGPNDGR